MKTSMICMMVTGCLAMLATTASAQDGQGGLVAVLDVAEVFKQTVTFKNSMEEIKSEIEAFEEDFNARREGLQRQIVTLQKNPTAPSYKEEEARLARLEADMQIEANQKRADILAREAKVYHTTYQQLQSVLGNVATQYNISLVLRYDSSPIDETQRPSVIKGVNRNVVFQRNLDLTQMVIGELNKGQVATPTN